MYTKKSISRIFSVLFVIVFILAVMPPQAAHGAGIRYAKPGGTGNCSSWANACTVQTALTGAASGDEMWAAAGTYKPTTLGTDRTATFPLKNGVALYGGFAGTETARSQRNPALNVTILSGEIGAAGNSDNSYHVVTGATGATLDGFIITAGNANGASDLFGGGMVNIGSSPALMNVTFSGNTATYGGGMANLSGSPTLTNVTFSGNTASVFGGGMHNYDSATLTNVTFSGNSATYGGGMANGGGSPTLTNVTFSGNAAGTYGGGMDSSSDSPAQVRNTIFWGNTAGSDGAQIYYHSGSPAPSVSYSVVQGGYALGTHVLSADPKLGDLGNYGGFTETIPLLAGSSAIDTGDNAVCPATDQRGYVRPADGDGNGSVICDIGAYEAGSAPPLPPVYVYLPLVQSGSSNITPTPTPTVTPGTMTPTSTPTATPTRAPTTPPPPGPRDGIYKFSSGVPNMDRNASLFRVSANTIPWLLVYINPDIIIDECSFGYIYTPPSGSGQYIPIIGGSFSYSQGTNFTISGSFTDTTTATGTIHIYYYEHTTNCNFTYDYSGPWQASWWSSYP